MTVFTIQEKDQILNLLHLLLHPQLICPISRPMLLHILPISELHCDHDRFDNGCYIFINAFLFFSPPAPADHCQGGYDAVANIRAEVFFFRGIMFESKKHWLL